MCPEIGQVHRREQTIAIRVEYALAPKLQPRQPSEVAGQQA
jgi:hypothetical protein